jgi:hypothetical protein
MDVNALLKALQTTLRFEQEMASRFGASTPAPAPPVRRDSGRESDHAFPYSSGVQREPETEVRNFAPTLHDSLLSLFCYSCSSAVFLILSFTITLFFLILTLSHYFSHHLTFSFLTLYLRLKQSVD